MTSMGAVLLLAVATAYFWGAERLWRQVGRGRLITARHAASGVLGLVAALVALTPPVDDAAHRLLSVHMVQHLLLLLPAAVFLANARIATALLWLLPARGRRWLARRSRPLRRWAAVPGWLTIMWMTHVVITLAWHVPAAYESALRSSLIHVAEHATMAGTGVALWWMVLRGKSFGAGAAYAAAAGAAGSVLGALMVFARGAWYPTYVGASPKGGALADQQLAGAIMWVLGGAGYLLVGVGLFVAWLRWAQRRPDERWRQQAARLTTWLLFIGVMVVAVACRPSTSGVDPAEAAAVERGRGAIVAYGCVACHQVPGVAAPQGDVGPPLDGFADRRVIAGQLPNTPDNLRRWIQDPQAVDPGNVMPNLGVSDSDAAAIAAYLATLE